MTATPLPTTPPDADEAFAIAYGSAWCDHMELAWMTQAYIEAWNEQRHNDCIMIINRSKAIQGSVGRRRFVARRDEYQRDRDEYAVEMGEAAS